MLRAVVLSAPLCTTQRVNLPCAPLPATPARIKPRSWPAGYRRFGFPGADNLGNIFQFQRDFADDSLKARSLEVSRQLNPALQSFGAWLVAHAKQIPMEMAAA